MVFITLYSKKMPQPQLQPELELELKAVLRDLGAAMWTWFGKLGSSLRALFARLLLVLGPSLFLLLPLLLIQTQTLSHAQTLSAPGVQVSEFKLERQDDAYVLSSTLSFELPQAVEDALSKGIALYFMAEVQVAKERWYWYDKYFSKQERYYRLSYNPLSRRWRLATSSKPINTSGLGVTMGVPYDSLAEALSAIKRSGEWRVVEASEIEPGGKYRLDYQFKLDLTQFPRPFQIGTLGESDWSMSVKRSQALVYESSKSP